MCHGCDFYKVLWRVHIDSKRTGIIECKLFSERSKFKIGIISLLAEHHCYCLPCVSNVPSPWLWCQFAFSFPIPHYCSGPSFPLQKYLTDTFICRQTQPCTIAPVVVMKSWGFFKAKSWILCRCLVFFQLPFFFPLLPPFLSCRCEGFC